MFAELPEDVLCLISEGLNRRRDRYHLAVSCRRFYAVLLPILFYHVHLCETRRLHSIGQVSRFLYALVRNPKLASSVRVLELGCWETPKDYYSPPPLVLETQDGSERDFAYNAQIIHTLLDESRCSEDERAQWNQDVEFGITDAWLALLIPRLRGLRKISLTWPYYEGEGYVSKMLERAASGKGPGFPYLDEAFGCWYDSENAADTFLMHPFLKMPAMRKLGGFSLEEDVYRSNERQPSAPFSSGIVDIDLDRTNASHGMRHWIESCKALRSFRINHGGATVGDGNFNPRALYQSLLLHRKTLERIWIRSDEDNFPDEDGPWMGSFAEFPALKLLHASLRGLALVDDEDEPGRELKDVLPPSLENLYLWDCDTELSGWAVEQMESLIGSQRLPKLKTLNFESPKMQDPGHQRKLEQLGQQCQDAGIAFNANKWTDWPLCPSFLEDLRLMD